MPREEKKLVKLKDELKNILKDEAISHVQLSKRAKLRFGKGQGFSTAAISNLIGDSNKSANKLIPPGAERKLIKLIQVAKEIAEEKKNEPIASSGNNNKLSMFLDNQWYLYYYVRGESIAKEKDAIARAILKIGPDAGSVFIENKFDLGESNFQGKVELYKENYLLFFLKTEVGQEGYLFINTFIGREIIYPVSIGIYTNINRDLTGFVAGTIILEHIPKAETLRTKKPKLYIFGSTEFEELAPEIRQFFSRKEDNLIDVPYTMFDFHRLAKFNKQHRNY